MRLPTEPDAVERDRQPLDQRGRETDRTRSEIAIGGQVVISANPPPDVAVLELRDRLIFKLAVLMGLRPGEIFD